MSRFLNSKYCELEAYTPGEQPKIKNIIKLNTNENPYPPSPAVERKLRELDTDMLRRYPDPNVSDLVGAILFPFGAYFPGFTLTAAFSGLVYGLMLGGKPALSRILMAYLITTVVVTLGFNTLFTAILYVKGTDPWHVKYLASLSTRLTQAAIMLFIQSAFTYLLLNQLSLTERIQKAIRR